ncbi:MAG: tRNA (adenosine(37)-N6)-threonylcarbamoyltransferase complex transferase subunit TsaD [Cyclobacteriaceae bacterium]
MRINILAIESSCDETAAAVIQNGKLLNNIIASQSVHAAFGGVVPELASRAHEKKIVAVVNDSLNSAGMGAKDLDAVAYTRGPGLIGSLLVGASFAKGMALAYGIPLIEVNHMQAHVMAHFIPERKPLLPFLCLTVSGGHTQLVLMRDMLKFELLGQTRDDAAGEAFDKGAKIMGLPYPGGPLIEKLAASGDPGRFRFPHTSMPGYDFSFSGIKTSLLYQLRDGVAKSQDFIERNLNDLCAGYQHRILAMLMEKLKKAAEDYNISSIGLAGGVAANTGLRTIIQSEARRHGWEVFIPDFGYCTDNAGMIAITAHYKFLEGSFSDMSAVPVASLGPAMAFDSQ